MTVENGYPIFREQNAAAPGVVSAVGYGGFDGHTWELGLCDAKLHGSSTFVASLDLINQRKIWLEVSELNAVSCVDTGQRIGMPR